MREAAGLDAVLDEEHGELLRFVTRMAASAERRDLLEPGSGGAGTGLRAGGPGSARIAFPPLKRRIRPIPPNKAAQAWLARFRALAGPEEARRQRMAAAAASDGADVARG